MRKSIPFGVTKKELIIVILFYIFFSYLYYLAISISQGFLNTGEWIGLFDFTSYYKTTGLHYTVFFILSAIIWYVVFRMLKGKGAVYIILAHLIAWPVFIFGSKIIYYQLCDLMGWLHMSGTSQVWDLYIPGLFYLLQFGLLHAYVHFRENQRKLIVEGELRQAALKSELAAIKAQLNPHFLYNVFNTINASVPPKQEKTRMLIATLSDLFRYQLKATKSELVTLREELEFVEKYLELEKARFEDRLDIEINVPKELYSEKIPPMLLQPLVENSVKHGISNTLKGGKITISIFKEGEKLKFEIADTGAGVKDKESIFNKGVGLTNTRLRLQKMYQSHLEILDNEPQGLKIRFAL